MSSPKPAGLTQIFGTAMLSNMRSERFQPGSTRVLVDAMFNVVDGDEPMLLALLRLDSAPSRTFMHMQQDNSRPFALACVGAKVSRMTESSVRAELMPRGRTWQSYAFLGDVDELVVVELADTTTDDDVHEVFLQTRSNFNLTGIVTASDTSSFNVEPSFHVPAFPVHCFPSFANKDRAATPSQGSLVTVEGFLDQVKRGARNAVTSVEVEVDQFRVFKPPRIVPDPGPRATCLFHHEDDFSVRRNMEGAYHFRVAAEKHPFYLTHFEKDLILLSKVIRECLEERTK